MTTSPVWTSEERRAVQFSIGLAVKASGRPDAPVLARFPADQPYLDGVMDLYFKLEAGLERQLSEDQLFLAYKLLLDPPTLIEARNAGEIEGNPATPANMPPLSVFVDARLACVRRLDPARAELVTLSQDAAQTLYTLIDERLELAQQAGITGGPEIRSMLRLLAGLRACPVVLDMELASEALDVVWQHAGYQMMAYGMSCPEAPLLRVAAECLPAGWPSRTPHPVQEWLQSAAPA